MEKQIAFTGILSNKPQENPGIFSNLKSNFQQEKDQQYCTLILSSFFFIFYF